MVMKHTEDDGDLSIFAAGDEILFACRKGHYWLVQSDQKEVEAGRLLEADEAASVTARFGASAERYFNEGLNPA